MTDELRQEMLAAHRELDAERQRLQAELDAQLKVYQEKAKLVFKKLCANVFELCPAIKTVWWRQYTPSHNDGDPCTFNVYDIWVSNATRKQLEEDSGLSEESFYKHETLFVDWTLSDDGYQRSEDSEYREKYMANISREENEVLHTLCKFVSSNEDLMEKMFGEAQVVVTKDGIDSEEYYDY